MGEQVAARLWGCSSVGRAPALQAGGQGFESPHLHGDRERSGDRTEAQYKSASGFPKKQDLSLYLENYTQKYLITKVKKETRRLERHPGMCESTYRNRKIPKERRT